MKGYAATVAAAPPGKRRWRCFAVAVFALVFCSLLVPLAVLLGLHNRFPSGYLTDDRSTSESNYGAYERLDVGGEHDPSEGDNLRIDHLVKKLAPTFAQKKNSTSQSDGDVHKQTSGPSGPPAQHAVASADASFPHIRNDDVEQRNNNAQNSAGLEIRNSCQLEFGSYCLWSIEHKEAMKDSTVRRLKDQLFVARAYYPSIAKLHGHQKLTLDVKQNIQEYERMLSDTISDADLPKFVGKKIEQMDKTIAKAKSCAVDCHNIDKKLRQILDLTEDEAHFHMKQSAFLYHLGAQTLPKSFHCLSMRLTVEYFKSLSGDVESSHDPKVENTKLQHYVIFSKNILATSVTINSTVMNSKESGNMVFHLVTDGQNFYTFKHWFVRNSYKEATVHVLNFDNLQLKHLHNLDVQQLSPSEEFRVSIRHITQSLHMQFRTEYLSVFGHSHFLIPDIFANLKKVVVLDDDVVIQRDLSFLWNLDLEGKVNGALQLCGVRLGQFHAHMGGYRYNSNSCAWISGLNIVDLEKWRKHNITGFYFGLLQKLQNGTVPSWRAAALPISLLAFQDLIYPLDISWVQSGLGHDYGVPRNSIENAAVLHYNGNMKPWLEFGIPKFKNYWKKFLTQDEQFMDDCNVHP
ncbi:probable galacturonosyltransferase 7 isoform X2 [Typha angustifolia]|uniref:probable galacturonosyltransferase 7 isoform X2 n=1 Tax=Typha angustifolia TaxID=59011 RepID=UPI003C2D9541